MKKLFLLALALCLSAPVLAKKLPWNSDQVCEYAAGVAQRARAERNVGFTVFQSERRLMSDWRFNENDKAHMLPYVRAVYFNPALQVDSRDIWTAAYGYCKVHGR